MLHYFLAMIINPVLRNAGTHYGITAILFTCLVLLAWVKIAYPQKIPLLIKEVFTYKLEYKEKNITAASVVLFIIFLCCAVLIITQLMHTYGFTMHTGPIEEIGLAILALFAFYLSKTIVIMLAGFIFEEHSMAWEYVSALYVSAHFLGIVLLPLLFISTYASHLNPKILDEVVLGLIAVLIIYRTTKVFILMINKGLRMFYLFLYICALEILPLALFIRYGIMSL